MQEDSVCRWVSASVITESQTASPLKNGMQLSLHDIEPGSGGKQKQDIVPMHYNSVGRGVGDSCSFGAYLAKKGKKTVSMTPTIASM